MYKYIFCDLDGTLLNDDKKISSANLKAIERARAAGIGFAVCTGRLPFCFVDYIKPLVSEDYVAANGSLVHYDGKDIVNNHLSYEDSGKLLHYAEKRNLCLRIFTRDYLYIVNDTHLPWSYKNQMTVSIEEAMEIIREKDIAKLGIVLQSGQDYVKADIDAMNINAEAVYSSTDFLEVNACGANKGNGIRLFCKEANISLEEVIGIGDNDNDISMLNTAGLSVCPANGCINAKEAADVICPVDNNHDAVAWVINRYVFGEEC
ncbi:MAG: Cof-type HAD-IIB family hydrolase [Erysipelotrichaceae bacterium]